MNEGKKVIRNFAARVPNWEVNDVGSLDPVISVWTEVRAFHFTARSFC
jgi:hypothetical protein